MEDRKNKHSLQQLPLLFSFNCKVTGLLTVVGARAVTDVRGIQESTNEDDVSLGFGFLLHKDSLCQFLRKNTQKFNFRHD